jgi:hypothetical protein
VAIWKDPTGRSSYGIAICGRCSQKFFLDELVPDPNTPGLMVCRADRDHYDPYRLPARQTEKIALQFTRPDLPLTFDADADTHFFVIGIEPGISQALATETGVMLEAEGIV